MKKLKEFLCFLISFIVLGVLMLITFIIQIKNADVISFMGGAQYLKLLFSDPTFITALIKSYVPISVVAILLCSIYKIVAFVLRKKLNITRKLDYIILFGISFIAPVVYIVAMTKFFDFTNNLIFSLQIATDVTFVFWLIELINEKIKERKL